MKKIIIQILLAAAALYLGYMCYQSVQNPIQFQKLKKQRYDRVIQKLKDIRTAQDAFKSIHGTYTSSFDSLINFVKYDSLKTVRSIGELTDDQLEEGMTEQDALKKGLIIRDTMRVSALEQLFGKNYPIDDLRYVPFTKKKHEFLMGTNMIWTDSGIEVPVFEARISNMVIFEDLFDEYEDAILWLEQAGLVNKVVLSKSPRLPLKAYDDLSTFKLYALDIGLLRQLSELGASVLLLSTPGYTEYKGALAENYVLQSLTAQFQASFRYWTSGNKAEVDFLLQHGNHIYPIEVKADQNITGKSLIQYEKLYQPACRIRYSMLNLKQDGNLINIPLFLADKTKELLNNNVG